jgi:glycosyltransferase involved in cell wall biosynthesis
LKLLVLTAGLETSTLDPASTWVHELTERLAARGHRMTVLCTRPEPRGTDQGSIGVATGAADLPGVTTWCPAERDLVSVLEALLELEPDVVHLAATGPLSQAAVTALAHAPLLVDLVDWSILCPAGDLLARPNGEACPHHHPIAPCGTCVGHSHVRAMEPLMAFGRSGHRVLAHAGHVRDRATLALGRGIALVPVGVDPAHFAPGPAGPLSPEVAALVSDRKRPRVVTLGPPTPARGGDRLLDFLIAIHARSPEAELVVPGVDPGNPDLLHIMMAEAKELGVAGQLRPIPRVSHADLPALLGACDVGVAPGVAPEPLGLSIVQALAVGLPVVAHDAGAGRELLQEGTVGVLADWDAMAPFADAVSALLADPARRTALGERARLAALERHDIERAVFDTEQLYERVRGMHAMRLASAPPRGRRAAA